MGAMVCSVILMSQAISIYTQAADNHLVDPSKKGAITIYKYDLTAASRGGVDLTKLGDGTSEEGNVGETYATGEKNSYAEQVLSDYAVQGVEFQYLKVGDMEIYNNQGNVIPVYDIPQELQTILGLTPQEAVKTENEKTYFTSQSINEKMEAIILSEEQQNTAAKNKLEAYLKDGKGTAFSLTDQNGKTTVSGLDLGLYLIVETKVPEQITATTNPWFVQLPMTSYSGENFMYEVNCYPKNQTGVATLGKKMRNAREEEQVVTNNGQSFSEFTAQRKEYTYSDTVTAQEGENLDVYLDSMIPHITSSATYLSTYTFVDTMAKGMEFQKNAVVAIYPAKGEGVPNNYNVSNVASSGAKALWRTSDEKAMFTEKYGTDAEGNATMTIAFTEEGLKKINQEFSDHYMVIYYNATLGTDEKVVLGDRGNPNEVALTWKRTSLDYYDVLKDQSIVYSYGMRVLKTFSDDRGDPTKVQFLLKNTTDDYYITAKKESDGHYHVIGKAVSAQQATKLSPNAEGKLYVAGMEADEYDLQEVKTDTSYSLLKEDVHVGINATEAVITPTQEGDVVVVTTNASAKVNETTPTFAKDTNYVKTSLQKENGDSTNAVVELEVKNMKGFLLPQTGGAGASVLVILGVFLMAGGYLLSGRKKNYTRK